MAVPLHVHEIHDHEQIANMEAGRRRVEADIPSARSPSQVLGCPFGCILQQPSPPKFFYQFTHAPKG
jgi:hypothetical protein